MSHTPIVSVSMRPDPGAVPEAHFYDSSNFGNGFISFDGSGLDAPALFLPPKVPDAVAYLDALIHAACDLRNHYVEWAKVHEITLAA